MWWVSIARPCRSQQLYKINLFNTLFYKQSARIESEVWLLRKFPRRDHALAQISYSCIVSPVYNDVFFIKKHRTVFKLG